MNKTIKKVLTNFLKLTVSVLAISWVLSKISFNEVLKDFTTANLPDLGLAFLFLFFSMIISAFRQNLSFRNTGADLSQMLNIKLFWLGMFYNLFLPGGIGGDGYKVYLVNKYRQNGIRKNIGTMLVNRIAGLVAVGMITIVLYYFSAIKLPLGGFFWIGIPGVYILYLIVLQLFFKQFFPIHLGLFGWSVLLQILQLLSALFILLAFHQTTNLLDYLFLFFVSSIATALPITIGGIGAREMVFLLGAKVLQLDNELCISLSFMFFLLSAVQSLAGVYWVFYPPFRRESVPDVVDEPLKSVENSTAC